MLRLFGHFIPLKMLALLILEMAVLGGTVYYLLSTGVHSRSFSRICEDNSASFRSCSP